MALSLLRRIARVDAGKPALEEIAPAPAEIAVDGAVAFPFAERLTWHEGLPLADWKSIEEWLGTLPEGARPKAWDECERAWMLHLRDALGRQFRMDEGPSARVVSSLEPKIAKVAIGFMERSLKRIERVLDGIAKPALHGKDLLIVFDDADAYYRYASHCYPERGEFAISSGMRIASSGCSHYITTKADFQLMEPVIVHEMTHELVGHLAIPLWLNEGLAVNTEHRIAGEGRPLHTPQEMHEKHLKFWGSAEVQEFWSGRSFQRMDDGNLLSYDLGRILVEQLSAEWPRFATFVNTASYEDGGAAAARDCLGVSLGSMVAAMMGRDGADWEPRPALWEHDALTRSE